MAQTGQKDLLTRLADAGEDAIHRLAEAPGADRVVGAMNSMRDRVDEMQKRIRGLEAIERRVVELERRLDKIEGGAKSATTRKPSTAKQSSARTTKATSTSARKRTGSTRKSSSS